MTIYRFLIPVVFGVAAAVANVLVLRGKTQEIDLLVVAKPLAAGQVLKADHLKPTRVRLDNVKLVAAAIKAETLVLYIGKRVNRSMAAEHLLLEQDIEEGESLLAAPSVAADEQRVAMLLPADTVGDYLTVGQKLVVRYPSTTPGQESKYREIGPYRYLGCERVLGPDPKKPLRRVVLAAPKDDKDLKTVADLAAARTNLRQPIQLQPAT